RVQTGAPAAQQQRGARAAKAPAQSGRIKVLTQDFREPTLSWELRGRACAARFGRGIQAVRVGLYALLVSNVSRFDIMDNNGLGKCIVPSNRGALKFGKFQGGIIARELQNYDPPSDRARRRMGDLPKRA